MGPWYRGFRGTVRPTKGEKRKYDSVGVWSEKGNRVEITELPLRRWTVDYKEFLHSLMPGSEKKSKIKLQELREYHTENSVNFVLQFPTGADLNYAKAPSPDAGFNESM